MRISLALRLTRNGGWIAIRPGCCTQYSESNVTSQLTHRSVCRFLRDDPNFEAHPYSPSTLSRRLWGDTDRRDFPLRVTRNPRHLKRSARWRRVLDASGVDLIHLAD